MTRLQQIAAEHDGVSARRARERSESDFARRMEEQAKIQKAREDAMRAALKATGRVIFPARWSVDRARDRDWEYRLTTRWEGLRLECVWRRGSAGATFTKLKVRHGKNSAYCESPATLAKLIREWGLV